MNTLNITAGNVNYPHDHDYILDLPSGRQDCWVFIHCLSKCELGTADGIKIANKGDCIIYSPGHPQWNVGIDERLFNDWLHLSGSGVAELLIKYNIPQNKIMHPVQNWFIGNSILSIRKEIYSLRPHYQESLSHRLQLFIIELSRQLNERRELRLTQNEQKYVTPFRQLREYIHQRFDEDWTIDLMAEQAGLSRSRFSVLYAKIFSISPINDLIETRIQHAKELLFEKRYTVDVVAELCGFKNVIYFHRMFKKKVGCPPREFTSEPIEQKQIKTWNTRHHL